MNVKKKSKKVTFTTIEEYLAFYSVSAKDKPSRGSKYYRMGEGVAKMACDKAIHKMQDKVNVVNQ